MLVRIQRNWNPHAGGNVNGTASVEKFGSTSKCQTELPYNPSIALLGLFPKEVKAALARWLGWLEHCPVH